MNKLERLASIRGERITPRVEPMTIRVLYDVSMDTHIIITYPGQRLSSAYVAESGIPLAELPNSIATAIEVAYMSVDEGTFIANICVGQEVNPYIYPPRQYKRTPILHINVTIVDSDSSSTAYNVVSVLGHNVTVLGYFLPMSDAYRIAVGAAADNVSRDQSVRLTMQM